MLEGERLTAVRTTAVVGNTPYVVLCDLARPINRRALQRVGTLEEVDSIRVMETFGMLLAR